MNWITENIALGNFLDAQNPPAEIDSILCLKPDCCQGRKDIDVLHIPLVDGSGNNPVLFKKAVDFIRQRVFAGKRILVHCHAGKSRSVCIVARYLMEEEGLSRDDALAKISSKREIHLTNGIEEIFSTIRI